MAMPFASLSPAADHHRPSSMFPFCRSSPLYSPPVVGEEASPHHQQQQQHAMSARWAARPAPFTAAQYEELEHQALIYKYLVAGVPVPPDLLLPIRRGFDSLAARFYHHPAPCFHDSFHVATLAARSSDTSSRRAATYCQFSSALPIFHHLTGKLAFRPSSGDVVVNCAPSATNVKFMEDEFSDGAKAMRRASPLTTSMTQRRWRSWFVRPAEVPDDDEKFPAPFRAGWLPGPLATATA